MTVGAKQQWRAVGATLGACALVVLVGWAALIGPSQLLTGPGPTMSSATTTTPTETPSVIETRPAVDVDQDYSTGTSLLVNLLGFGFQLVCLALMGLALWLLARRALRAWQLRRQADSPPADADFDTIVGGPVGVARQAMAADAEEQLRLLRAGHPRNAIVECWHRFEVQAERAGLARHRWETSSEFALRLLDRAAVDPDAVGRLLGLYREARFSEHDLGEEQREAALAALQRIQASAVTS